jgi:N-sulfoglucosamine sulfohydrolase
MNIVFISADDMSYYSMGLANCEISTISPNIDELGRTGAFFTNAHTTVGLCQPSRSVWMTGLYPWNNGATGFNNVFDHVHTLIGILARKGYQTGIIGKAEHLTPSHKFDWNYKINGYTRFAKWGKDAECYYELTKNFLKVTKKPFFLMVNSHFPHRPFEEKSRYNKNEVKVPSFLPDTPEVREEISLYYEGVSRCDYTVKRVLDALKETNSYEDTLIIFTSDHGMAFPFVKACCYHFSTKVPLIWHNPLLIEPKIVNDYVGGVDIFPTILDLLNIKAKSDGDSYKNSLQGNQKFKEEVYTCLCQLYSGEYFQTRAIHNKDYCYIINFWADGIKEFHEDGSLENQPSLKSLKLNHPKMYKKLRVRSKEEFYNLEKDPFARNNILSNSLEKKKMRQLMIRYAKKTNDLMTINKFLNKII